MREFFKKENRISFALSKSGKQTDLFYLILSISLYVLGSFSFFEFLYEVCNMIGAIVSGCPAQALVELGRMLPLLVSLGVVVHLGILTQVSYRSPNREYQRKVLKVNGIIIAVFGLFISVYIIVGLICNTYHTFFENYPSLLFPFDVFILGLVYIALGIFLAFFSDRFISKRERGIEFRKEYRPFVLCGIDNFFLGCFYLTALFGFAAFIYSFWTMDFIHGDLFYCLMLDLLFILPTLLISLHHFVYLRLKEELKEKFQRKFSFISLIVSIVIFILYVIALTLNPQGPNAAFGLLPVEYTAKANASTYIFGLFDIIVPLVAFIRLFIFKKKDDIDTKEVK